jgi:hypothetical protein
MSKFLVIGDGDVTMTNSLTGYSCNGSPGVWRAAINGQTNLSGGDLTLPFNNCDGITIQHGPFYVVFCCPYVSTAFTWENATICPDAPPPYFTSLQILKRSIFSRMRKIKA